MKAKAPAPFAALARGVFFGALILGMLFFVKSVFEGSGDKPATGTVASASPAPKPAPDLPALPPIAKPQNPDQLPPIDAFPAAPAEQSPKLAAIPPPDAPPMADAPAKPLDPFAPPMATTPAPADPFAAPPAPADPFAAPVAPVAAIVVPGMTLRVTRPVEVQIPFGKIKLIPGNEVKLVAQEGANLRVKYGASVIVIPSASTNIDALPPPAPVPVVHAPIPAPAPATPAPRGDSLFGAPPLTNLPAAPKPATDF